MKLNINYKWLILTPTIIIIFTLFLVFNQGTISIVTKDCSNQTIGIIDGKRSEIFNNVFSNNEITTNPEKQHGDYMIEFAQTYCDNVKIYYYDASNDSGSIKTDGILDGLNWMLNNNVKKVDLSISTKIYSKDLENWIKEHNKSIQLYSSYNNLLNSRDYPAMYDYVIASGSNSKIPYKDFDTKYKKNIIILNGKTYEGNSYLSLYTLLKSI